MKRSFFVLSLAVFTVMAGASDAFAQRLFGGGYGNGSGVSIGFGRGIGFSQYGGYYGGSRYNPYYQNYGNAYQYSPSYYDLGQSFSVVPQIQDSFYQPAVSLQQSVSMTVLVPRADAQVWFQGAPTSQQGMERVFHSPPLEPNHTFVYTIKARWMDNGQVVNQERQVNVQVGQNTVVNFRERAGETVPTPRN